MTSRITKATVSFAAGLGAWLLLAVPAPPAFAVGSVSMTTSPSATISGWSLAAVGSNTTAGGTIAVTAVGAYSVTVQADKTRMTEYITASSAYASSPKTLGSPLSVLTTLTGGVGVPLSPVAVGTSASTIATGITGTDSYSVTLSQPTAITDAALAAGRTYHIALTYTASSTV